jgi:hypothetical protein
MDFAVGATHNDCDYANSGAVWMFYGPATSGMETTSADATWCSAETGHLGAGLAGVPDTDGDGDDELAIGSYYTGTSGMARRGAVWIWEGQG